MTFGVADVKGTKRFYEDTLGCRVDKSFGAKFVSFDVGDGRVLGVYTRAGLAKDAGVSPDGDGFSGIVTGMTVDSPAGADAILAAAAGAGTRVRVGAARASHNGDGGYFEDPEGNVWSVTSLA